MPPFTRSPEWSWNRPTRIPPSIVVGGDVETIALKALAKDRTADMRGVDLEYIDRYSRVIHRRSSRQHMVDRQVLQPVAVSISACRGRRDHRRCDRLLLVARRRSRQLVPRRDKVQARNELLDSSVAGMLDVMNQVRYRAIRPTWQALLRHGARQLDQFEIGPRPSDGQMLARLASPRRTSTCPVWDMSVDEASRRRSTRRPSSTRSMSRSSRSPTSTGHRIDATSSNSYRTGENAGILEPVRSGVASGGSRRPLCGSRRPSPIWFGR